MTTDRDEIADAAIEMRRAERERMRLDDVKSTLHERQAASAAGDAARKKLRAILDRVIGVGCVAIFALMMLSTWDDDLRAGDGIEAVRSAEISIVDGDTIEHRGIRYRLMGFDTPETINARCATELQMGRDARTMLIGHISSVEFVAIWWSGRVDRYGRRLGKLFVTGKDVAETMIGAGLARDYHGGARQGWCADAGKVGE